MNKLLERAKSIPHLKRASLTKKSPHGFSPANWKNMNTHKRPSHSYGRTKKTEQRKRKRKKNLADVLHRQVPVTAPKLNSEKSAILAANLRDKFREREKRKFREGPLLSTQAQQVQQCGRGESQRNRRKNSFPSFSPFPPFSRLGEKSLLPLISLRLLFPNHNSNLVSRLRDLVTRVKLFACQRDQPVKRWENEKKKTRTRVHTLQQEQKLQVASRNGQKFLERNALCRFFFVESGDERRRPCREFCGRS